MFVGFDLLLKQPQADYIIFLKSLKKELKQVKSRLEKWTTFRTGALTIWMKFSLRMFWQMVLHVLYLEKENGNVLYHLPEKRVVPVEKQMKRSIFCGTCNFGQMVQKFPWILVKARRREYLERYYLFSENIPPGWTIPFEFFPELPKIPFKW